MVATLQQALWIPEQPVPLPVWTPQPMTPLHPPMGQQVLDLMDVLRWTTIPADVCYLLHLDTPLLPATPHPKLPNQHADHYLGTTHGWRLLLRLWEHEAAQGEGARFLQVARQRGITWELTRLWEGNRRVELRLKQWNYKRLCPRCTGDLAWGRGNYTVA